MHGGGGNIDRSGAAAVVEYERHELLYSQKASHQEGGRETRTEDGTGLS